MPGYAKAAGMLFSSASAGIGAYQQVQQTQGNERYQDAMNKWQIDRLHNIPQLKGLDLQSVGDIFNQFLGQRSEIPGLQHFADTLNNKSNAAYQQRLEGTTPGLLGSTAQFSQNTNQLLQGQIPADVQEQINRNAAQTATLGGFGASSGMGRNLQARDFGLTSLNLMQQGAQQLPQVAQLAAVLNPSNQQASNYLFAPGALMQRSDQQSVFNNQITNTNLDRAALAKTPYMPSLKAYDQNDSTLAVIQGVLGSLGSSLGGSTGAGGAGGFQAQPIQGSYGAAPSYGSSQAALSSFAGGNTLSGANASAQFAWGSSGNSGLLGSAALSY